MISNVINKHCIELILTYIYNKFLKHILKFFLNSYFEFFFLEYINNKYVKMMNDDNSINNKSLKIYLHCMLKDICK